MRGPWLSLSQFMKRDWWLAQHVQGYVKSQNMFQGPQACATVYNAYLQKINYTKVVWRRCCEYVYVYISRWLNSSCASKWRAATYHMRPTCGVQVTTARTFIIHHIGRVLRMPDETTVICMHMCIDNQRTSEVPRYRYQREIGLAAHRHCVWRPAVSSDDLKHFDKCLQPFQPQTVGTLSCAFLRTSCKLLHRLEGTPLHPWPPRLGNLHHGREPHATNNVAN